jgi:hypothetical protein
VIRRTRSARGEPARATASLLALAPLALGASLAMALPLARGGGAPATAVAQEGPVMLQLSARTGETDTYRYEQNVNLQLPAEFGGAQSIASRLVLSQTAMSVSDDRIQYLAEIKDVSVEMTENPLGADLDFSKYKGQQFDMAMTRQGQLLGLEMAGANPAAQQIQQSMRQVGFPQLAGSPVRVGDTWTDTTRADAAGMGVPVDGDIISINRTTLERLTELGERTIANLSVQTTFTFQPRAEAGLGMSVEMIGSRSDDVRFDVTNGRFIVSAGSQSFTLNIGMAGLGGGFLIEGDSRSSAQLLEQGS